MHMIGHQTVTQDANVELLRMLFEQFKIMPLVFVSKKDLLTPVTCVPN